MAKDHEVTKQVYFIMYLSLLFHLDNLLSDPIVCLLRIKENVLHPFIS